MGSHLVHERDELHVDFFYFGHGWKISPFVYPRVGCVDPHPPCSNSLFLRFSLHACSHGFARGRRWNGDLLLPFLSFFLFCLGIDPKGERPKEVFKGVREGWIVPETERQKKKRETRIPTTSLPPFCTISNAKGMRSSTGVGFFFGEIGFQWIENPSIQPSLTLSLDGWMDGWLGRERERERDGVERDPLCVSLCHPHTNRITLPSLRYQGISYPKKKPIRIVRSCLSGSTGFHFYSVPQKKKKTQTISPSKRTRTSQKKRERWH